MEHSSARDADFDKLGEAAGQPNEGVGATVKEELPAGAEGLSENQAEEQSAENKPEERAEAKAEQEPPAQRVQELEQLVQTLKTEVEEYKDKYLRSLAEMENYRKRSMRERSEYLKYQGEPILFDLLSIVDDFERALQHKEADPEKLRAGVELIYKMFKDLLSKWEVKGESAVGQEFDPTKHSALSRVPVDDAKPGTIINELKKLYYYKDKLLRAAQVVVAGEKPKAEEAGVEAEAPEEDSEKTEES